MCRIAAYLGPSIPLERIVVLPAHSLMKQSLNATEAKLSVNGDGFGIAWYANQPVPGLYRDVLPAWSDGNLTSLCRVVQSGLFLAHVRASTVGGTSRSNCHPFTYDRWSFMHNGKLGAFGRIRRPLEASLPDELYRFLEGSTDSELLFLLLLANGLDQNPYQAVVSTLRQITELQGALTDPNRVTCVFSDGSDIFAFRYSSDGKSPSFYIGDGLDSDGCVLASEPLAPNAGRWTPVKDGTFGKLSDTGWSETQLNLH